MLNINVRRLIQLRTHNMKLYMFPLVDNMSFLPKLKECTQYNNVTL